MRWFSLQRVIDSVLVFLYSLQGPQAYALLLALLIGSGFGLPINEDILLLGAAALTLRGVVQPLPLIAVAWVGLLAADSMVFYWGRRFGARLLQQRFLLRFISAARLAQMQATMRRYGPASLFFMRFMPGLRTTLLFAAGSLKVRYRHLLIFDGAAALVELPLLVYAVRTVGGRWEEIIALLPRFQGYLLALLALLLLAVWLVQRFRSRL